MFVLLNKAFVILADDHFHYYPIKTSTNSLGLRFSPFWEPSHVFSWNWRLIFDVSWKFYYTTVYIGMFLYHLPLVEKLRFFSCQWSLSCFVSFSSTVVWSEIQDSVNSPCTRVPHQFKCCKLLFNVCVCLPCLLLLCSATKKLVTCRTTEKYTYKST